MQNWIWTLHALYVNKQTNKQLNKHQANRSAMNFSQYLVSSSSLVASASSWIISELTWRNLTPNISKHIFQGLELIFWQIVIIKLKRFHSKKKDLLLEISIWTSYISIREWIMFQATSALYNRLGQPGLMRWIFASIITQIHDLSLDLLTCSPVPLWHSFLHISTKAGIWTLDLMHNPCFVHLWGHAPATNSQASTADNQKYLLNYNSTEKKKTVMYVVS